jgi:drug/metabolite transporter (DMT)-like permease
MRWIVTAVVLLTAALAFADHGIPASARSGFDWTTGLLVAGAMAAVSLAAWAFFAPDRPEDRPTPTAPDRPEPEPPTR